MKKTVATAKRLLCLVCALALCLALAACGGSANSISEQSEEITQMNNAAPGGDIAAMPDGFAAPTDANKLANAVSGSSFVGAINLASYRHRSLLSLRVDAAGSANTRSPRRCSLR